MCVLVVVNAARLLLCLGMTRKISLLATTVLLLIAGPLAAQSALEEPLPVDGNIALNGSAVELNWFAATPPRVGAVTVKRRLYGETGGESWEQISPQLGPVMRFSDETVEPGIAYEYQVLRSARDIVDVGYWLTGVELPAREFRGNAYVIVDETIVEAIAPRLARFERDLTGDGWRVFRHDVPRGEGGASLKGLEQAARVKTWLQERYHADPFGDHAVILVGHVPVVSSGRVNPDGHHQAPHPTDLFYAAMDTPWRATKEGVLVENQLPGDFIDMQIGRIDFANFSAGDREREIHLLQSYFDKNHHWRTGLLGDLRTAYGSSNNLITEQYNLLNVVGPTSFTTGGHHDVGEAKPWLWGVDFGDYDGAGYAEKYANKAVFTLNFGSGKQRFDNGANAMVALLAQPWYPIATGWGGRPAWRLHVMALGGTIGEVHMRTVNNGAASQPYRKSMDYYPTGDYLWRNPIWVNLLGDPTSRAFPLAPPSQLVAARTDQGVRLSWTASIDPDVTEYRLYRAPKGSLDFKPLAGGAISDSLTFIDATPEESAQYMVRAYGLKDVYAGSFYTFSQGVFADPGTGAISAADLDLAVEPGATVALPDLFNQVEGGRIHAIIEGPRVGALRHDGTAWRYTPPDGFAGAVTLRYSVSDGLQTREGRLTLTVGK